MSLKFNADRPPRFRAQYRVRNGRAAIGRYKALIGPRLRARGVASPPGEIALGAEVLNRMIRVAKPVSVRITGC